MAVPVLIEALSDEEGIVRDIATQALGEFGPDVSQHARKELRRLLIDQSPSVRQAAREALEKIEGGER